MPADTPTDAGFWKREVAYLLDALLLGAALNALLALPLGVLALLGGESVLLSPVRDAYVVLSHGSPEEMGAALRELLAVLGVALAAATAVYALVGWLYFALLESSRWQATLGKHALGIRVVDRDGAAVGFGRASARFFAAALSWATLNIGHALAAWTPHKRALHDYVAGTRVINVDPADVALPQWARVLVVLQAALFVATALVLAVAVVALVLFGAM